MKIRRSEFLFLKLGERNVVDVAKLLGGQIQLERGQLIWLISLPDHGKRHRIRRRDFDTLASVPEKQWTLATECAGDQDAAESLERLLECGAVLSDREDEESKRFREADEALAQSGWNDIAALYHFETVAQESRSGPGQPVRSVEEIAARSESRFEAYIQRHGPPPAAFHQRQAVIDRVHLPRDHPDGALLSLLRKRRTIRRFERKALPKDMLASLLRTAFGCLGVTELCVGHEVLWRTSPSAGSLHPIEPYVLIINVDGIQPSLCHYNAESHSLDQLRIFERDEIGEVVVRASMGQDYVREAGAVVVLAARYQRTTWKYRDNVRVPAVVAMDAGHLSQTFYLACAELGLGSFYSGAVNGSYLVDLLGLDRLSEGALGVLGCGWPHRSMDDLGLRREAFDPQ